MISFSASSSGPGLCRIFPGMAIFPDVVQKSGASENSQILERNGNALGNGNGVGGDALGMAKCFRVFKAKSAAECCDGVVVRLREVEGIGQLRRFSLDVLLQVHLVILVFGDELAVLPGAYHGMKQLILLEGLQDES